MQRFARTKGDSFYPQRNLRFFGWGEGFCRRKKGVFAVFAQGL